ncbi:aspartate 1-decarboxylase [Hyphomicrobiales bacterium]|nr:aspartate 1-decarboxylase [Hyphomicrobiales bacterium]MDA9904338.1 aspartate 1-decarboxylase [Hyphomicrobiales bacterium]MDB4247182.1 aspartate 1-decarboxylase [Hyphomicrobiales bacterium]
MKKTLLRSKLHRINVTQVELDYEGSCAVDTEILSKGNMQEYEKIDIYNVTNGERFSTYLMAAEAGSKTVSINGAAAHKASPNDIIIICSYGLFNEQEALSHEPVLVYFDSDNNIKSIKNAIPEQRL